MYKITPDSDWVKAVQHSRASKADGKFGVCFDGINEKAEMSWFDFNRCVSDWQPITQNEETEIVLFMNNEISETKMKELQTGIIVNES